jgi:spore germination cell wall hydrolase CwlJ-like protein
MFYRAIALAIACSFSLPAMAAASFLDQDLVHPAALKQSKTVKKRKRTSHRGKHRQARPASELACMARNIYFEAGIEGRKGKIAVANVTMNRVKSKHYPKSVCGVVFQRGKKACAFSWTCDAKSNVPPRNALYRESEQVARLALSGALRDITGKADHYHATYVKPRWRKSSKKSARIGKHVFYKMLDS